MKVLALDAIVVGLMMASAGASATTITCVKTSYGDTPQLGSLFVGPSGLLTILR